MNTSGRGIEGSPQASSLTQDPIDSSDSSSGAQGSSINLVTRTMNWFEKWLLALVLGGFIAGVVVASISQPVVDQVDSTINMFMDWYAFIAPLAIFLILSPSLARMFSTRSMGTFGLLVLCWFAIRKVLASLWAVAFVLIVFRIPILPQGSVSLADGLEQTMGSLCRSGMPPSRLRPGARRSGDGLVPRARRRHSPA